MPNADGSIWIKTEVDDKDAEAALKRFEKIAKKSAEKLADLDVKRASVSQAAQTAEKDLNLARERLVVLEEQARTDIAAFEALSLQRQEVSSLEQKWNDATGEVEKYRKEIEGTLSELKEAKSAVNELQLKITEGSEKETENIEKSRKAVQSSFQEFENVANSMDGIEESFSDVSEYSAEMDSGARRASKAMQAANKQANKFASRLKEVVRSALIFTLITQALAKFREWMGEVIKTNEEATAAFARLKGALLTLAQPLVNVILPAFTQFLNLLTAIVGEAAKVVSALFGTTIDQSAEAAENLQAEADAIKETGSAAKKAGKSLASFDEINKLSSGQTSAGGSAAQTTPAPNFDWADGVSENLQDIARSVLLIATGLALWKVSSALPGTLGTISNLLGMILIAFGGIWLAYTGFKDAWENGLDWGNMAALIGGVAIAAAALYQIFGQTGAGIALLFGGVALLAAGFKDVIENGASLQNTLTIIAGMVASGLGFYLLTGKIIPLVVAGIASIVYALAAMTGNAEQLIGNVKQIFSGLLDFFAGVFTNDIERMGEGVINIIEGVVNLALTIVGSLINAVIKGINWLIDKINSISFDVPDWVPGIGGKSLSPNLRPVKEWQIPQLATGAVIPPNREFMAVLGDQNRGYNIEAPEDLIRKIVREESGGGMNTALLQAILDAIREGKVLMVGRDEFAKLVYSSNQAESKRVGITLAGG